jgi:hypothetical protein
MRRRRRVDYGRDGTVISEASMLDLGKGWTWFVAGLGATLLIVVVLLVTVFLARRAEQHAGARRR